MNKKVRSSLTLVFACNFLSLYFLKEIHTVKHFDLDHRFPNRAYLNCIWDYYARSNSNQKQKIQPQWSVGNCNTVCTHCRSRLWWTMRRTMPCPYKCDQHIGYLCSGTYRLCILIDKRSSLRQCIRDMIKRIGEPLTPVWAGFRLAMPLSDHFS